MPEQPPNRDIIVIGASAGGLEALRVVLADLPADLPASVFVVLHVGAVSHLAVVLDQVSALPVKRAGDGERFEPGCVYVAPPGKHLLLHDDHVLLRRGPGENLARPAIDPLDRRAGEFEEDAELVRTLMRNGEAAVGVVTNSSLGSSLLHEAEER